jgi:hypothetical protein
MDESLTPTDIARLLESDRRDLVVELSTERHLLRTDEDAADFFELVVARRFDDLQALGFAPAALAEDPVRKAIADDDLEALRAGCRPCSGAWPADDPVLDDGVASRASFDDLRSTQHPHLARLVSEATGIEQRWDGLSVRVLAEALAQLEVVHELHIWVLLARDIVVHENGSLTIDAGISLLRARDIQLYQGARLELVGAYTKVVCNSVAGDLV